MESLEAEQVIPLSKPIPDLSIGAYAWFVNLSLCRVRLFKPMPYTWFIYLRLYVLLVKAYYDRPINTAFVIGTLSLN